MHRVFFVLVLSFFVLQACSILTKSNNTVVIYKNANFITMNDDAPRADYMVVKAGKIVDIGVDLQKALKKYSSSRPEVISLENKTVIPGIVDAHSHLSTVAVQAVSANLLPPPDGGAKDIPSLQRILKEHIKVSPAVKKHGIAIGFNYDDSQLAEKRHPTRTELDAVSSDIPIIAMHQSGHLAVYNSLALKMAGITKDTKNPPGGTIYREDDNVTPNGVMAENAHFMVVFKLIPRYSKDELTSMILEAEKIYLANGVTTIQDGRADPTGVEALLNVSNQNGFKVDIVAYADLEMNLENKLLQGPYMSNDYKNRFRIGGVKLSLDGSPQGKTAWFTKPYLVPPLNEKRGYKGFPIFKEDSRLQKLVDFANEKNWQLLVHANGDAAIDQLISVVKKSNKRFQKKFLNVVLIHGQYLRRDQILKLKKNKIFPSLYPMHTFYWGDWHRKSVAGEKRARFISPVKSLEKQGIKFSIHTDAPVIFPDSMRLLDSAVNRTTRSNYILGRDQRLSPLTALKAMTIWSATQYREDSRKGSLEVGKLADFVVLSGNPLKIKKEKLIDLKVLKTFKEGVKVYESK